MSRPLPFTSTHYHLSVLLLSTLWRRWQNRKRDSNDVDRVLQSTLSSVSTKINKKIVRNRICVFLLKYFVIDRQNICTCEVDDSQFILLSGANCPFTRLFRAAEMVERVTSPGCVCILSIGMFSFRYRHRRRYLFVFSHQNTYSFTRSQQNKQKPENSSHFIRHRCQHRHCAFSSFNYILSDWMGSKGNYTLVGRAPGCNPNTHLIDSNWRGCQSNALTHSRDGDDDSWWWW